MVIGIQIAQSFNAHAASQNSGLIRVTLAESEKLKSLSVRWPSGKLIKIEPVPERSLIAIEEHP